MLNPTSASQTPLSSRIALLTGLLLAGAFGLVATIVLPVSNFKKTGNRIASINTTAESATSVKTELFAGTTPSPSATDLVKFCSENVTEKRSFVIFQRGSCVIIDEPCQNPLAEARKKLAACAESDARFISEPTREGDLIVTFKEPVFQRFSADDLKKLSSWVEQSASTLLTPAEAVAAGSEWTPHENARFGLLARRRLLEDFANPIPVRIIRAKTREMSSN
jgi:hypothetical protein